ncbi:MAG: TIGR03936 family radical SAM-associated protein [Candidatus Margulisiibacteriota bacterium]
MFRIRLKFTKEEPIKYLSHRDLMTLLERAIRRVDLPVAFSQGYCPKMKLSVAWPLSVGMTSQCEYADIQMEKWVNVEQITPLLNHVMPVGSRLIESSLANLKEKSLTEQVQSARWHVEVSQMDSQPVCQSSEPEISPEEANIRSNNNVPDNKKNEVVIDISQYLIEETPEKRVYEMTLPAGPRNNTRIQDMFPKTASIDRLELILG